MHALVFSRILLSLIFSFLPTSASAQQPSTIPFITRSDHLRLLPRLSPDPLLRRTPKSLSRCASRYHSAARTGRPRCSDHCA